MAATMRRGRALARWLPRRSHRALAADEEPEPAIDPDLLEMVEAKLDEFAVRMDKLERRKGRRMRCWR